MIFMGSEFGQISEWYCKVSLDWHLIGQDELHKQLQDYVMCLNEIYKENTSAKEKVIQLVQENPRKDGVHHSSPKPPKPAYLRLNTIEIPALILVGEFDIPDVHAHAGAINAGIRHSKREIIRKSGHLIPVEQPELFNKAALKFLNEIDWMN